MRNKYLYITLLAVLGFNFEAQAQTNPKQPRLVVNITIDQLRSDYLDLFEPSFGNDGLRRLLQEGMVFENASYPFRDIDFASAISSVVSGTTPYYHTITGQQWIDRQSLRPVFASPEHLAVSTIGDELKMGTQGLGKVYAVAASKEIASLSAGHAADGIYWNQHPKKKWTSGEITAQAIQCISAGNLGQDTIPDILFLNYEAGGNDALSYTSLDEEIARLIGHTDSTIGKDNTLFIVTSTGYSDINFSQYENYHIPTGTFYINRTGNLLNMYFGALWGQGQYIEAAFKNHLYLNRQLFESRRINLSEAIQKAEAFIMQLAGAKKVETHFFEPHTGDLVIEVAPGWQLQNEDTRVTYPYHYPLAYFPIIIFGAGCPQQTVKTPVSIDRIAPSIAKAIRIRAPNACKAEPLF